ncbi:hypothetical protein I3842_14G044700 [Carya illinoinensis]|uniref:Uncharacterized protein n=1 Tax=Carya illinoinensis TaxID=32201 RepID=A0A922AAD5_CARIL|nr:hypothetical protein I3842_14G044700 [Carya illinoinensis]
MQGLCPFDKTKNPKSHQQRNTAFCRATQNQIIPMLQSGTQNFKLELKFCQSFIESSVNLQPFRQTTYLIFLYPKTIHVFKRKPRGQNLNIQAQNNRESVTCST